LAKEGRGPRNEGECLAEGKGSADSWLNATEPVECAITVTILNGFLTTFADLWQLKAFDNADCLRLLDCVGIAIPGN